MFCVSAFAYIWDICVSKGVDTVNRIRRKTWDRICEEAVFSLYMCLAHRVAPADGDTLRAIVEALWQVRRRTPDRDRFGVYDRWKPRDSRLLERLTGAIVAYPACADAVIGNTAVSETGLNACSFTKPDGAVSVVFGATGSGEWIDNGEGLSGIPQETVYHTYDRDGRVLSTRFAHIDYATDQQVEALNWFRRTAARNGWDEATDLTVSGYSKGGNKAQCIAVNEDVVDRCVSFCGQGFSPEAIAAWQTTYGEALERRCRRMVSVSTDNDYVNVLGMRLVPPEQVYFVKATPTDDLVQGYHRLETMMGVDGVLNPLCEQGELSRYVERVSRDLMALAPSMRQHAVLGVMNIIQGLKGDALNGDNVSASQTVAGIGISIGALLSGLLREDE